MSQPARTDGAVAPFTAGQELRRKALHLATATIPVLYARSVERPPLLALLGAGTAVALTIEWLRRNHTGTSALFDRFFGSLLRPHERRSLSGATWLCFSCFLAVLLLPRMPAVAAMWCATMGDSAAALAGRAWSSTRAGAAHKGKTAIGSLACLTVSAAGACLVAGYGLVPALVIGAAASVAERPTAPLDDNLRVMLASGLAAYLLT